jgi:hypothetical protein
MLCALMSVLEESMVDIRVELHVDLNRLNSAYVPMASMPSRRLLEGEHYVTGFYHIVVIFKRT